jgi:hypothetical protein
MWDNSSPANLVPISGPLPSVDVVISLPEPNTIGLVACPPGLALRHKVFRIAYDETRKTKNDVYVGFGFPSYRT